MEELLELKSLIHAGDTTNALLLIEEMEEMCKEDKINKIYDYAMILLINLIKQNAEGRTPRSWQMSIDLAVDKIQRINKRLKRREKYINKDEIELILSEAYVISIKQASLVVFEGVHDADSLSILIDAEKIILQALDLILFT